MILAATITTQHRVSELCNIGAICQEIFTISIIHFRKNYTPFLNQTVSSDNSRGHFNTSENIAIFQTAFLGNRAGKYEILNCTAADDLHNKKRTRLECSACIIEINVQTKPQSKKHEHVSKSNLKNRINKTYSVSDLGLKVVYL